MKKLMLLTFCLIGISTIAQEQLEVEGAIKIATTVNTAADGTIRYNGSDFEGKKAGNWSSLTDLGVDTNTDEQSLFLSQGTSLILTPGISGGGGFVNLDHLMDGLWIQNGLNAYYSLGSVGIGTANPLENLHIKSTSNSDIRLESPGSNYMRYHDGTAENGLLGMSSGGNFFMYNKKTGGVMNFGTQNSPRMTIDAAGNVGIGITNPTEDLHIKSATTGDIRLESPGANYIRYHDGMNQNGLLGVSGSGDFFMYAYDSGRDIKFGTEATTHMTLDHLGNLGIGTTAPSAKFDVVGDIEITDGDGKITFEDGNMVIYNDNISAIDKRAIRLETDGTGNNPYIALYNDDGDQKIKIDADHVGNSRITTDELLIKGGSDFAEHFDISVDKTDPLPGMIVSIDKYNPGKLTVSNTAYDTKVAGIISGANGVRTGVMMGQEGSIADGQYPIALTGRVYVYANEENGSIKPGDLLTTSSNKGEAMKAIDYIKAQGAIIGKAMTTIDKNGYVLVLVNLQ